MRGHLRSLFIAGLSFTSLVHAEEAHKWMMKLINSQDWKCTVLETKVVEAQGHNNNLCLIHTTCSSSSNTKVTSILPCGAQDGPDECPTLTQCLKNVLEDKKDSTTVTLPIFDKNSEGKIATKNEGVCSVAPNHTGQRAAALNWIEGPSKSNPQEKIWESFCIIPTVCTDKGITTSRYATICQPKKDDNGKLIKETDEVDGRVFKNYVCPSLKSCYEEQIVPRPPKTQYTTRNGGSTTSSSHSNR